jgi:outer membrane protein assembly factor BamE
MRKYLFVILSICSLSACSLFKTYHMPIQQGNQLSAEDVAKIKTGMTVEQVQAILGEPMLSKAYQNNQINYVYTLQLKGGVINEKYLILEVNNGKISQITEKSYPEKETR